MESVSKRTMSNQNTGNTVQQMESEFTPGVEIKIIVAVIFLMAFGLVMIFSASSYTSSISSATNYDSAFYFKKQLKMIILGMVAAGVVSVIPYKAFKKVGPLMYGLSIVLIFALKTPLGITSGGATRWLNLGIIQLQVADATKVGTLGSYWEANMELVDIVPEFNLYEEFWKIYTKTDAIPPQYIDASGRVSRCIIGEGTEVYGDVENSVIGSGVTIEKGAVIRNSIIMNNATIGENAYMDKAIIAENVKIGKDAKLGIGEEAVNEFKPQIYSFGLVTIGENSVVPDGVTIGKNTAISGVTTPEDYPDGNLKSGGSIIKAGE